MATKKCPRCGSTRIRLHRLPHFWPNWECRDCEYVGALIIENGKLPFAKDRMGKSRKSDRTHDRIRRRWI